MVPTEPTHDWVLLLLSLTRFHSFLPPFTSLVGVILNHVPRRVHALMVQAVFYTQIHILCGDKTKPVNLSTIFL